MSHKCTNLLIHCMDFRLIEETKKWMKKNNLINDCDVISIAGASKALIDSDNNIQEFLLKQIRVSIDLHHATKIIIVHHNDCGAYALDYGFENEDEEFAQQLEDMNNVSQLLENCFSDVEIIRVWAQMNENGIEFTELD